jgi:probable HAF family extracellular repeat protein
MRATRTAKRWSRAWGLMLFSVGIFHIFSAQAQQDTSTDQVEQGDDAQNHPHKYHHYQLIDIGTFGGPTSGINTEPGQNVINSKGTVVGGADTSIPTTEPNCYNPIGSTDCFISHAFVWRANSLKDLGTLPGGNFSFATALNQRGQIAGLSENDQIDPFSGYPEFHAVLWQSDQPLDLGTLGGVSSLAFAVNNRGQVAGVALNDVPDPFSILGTGDGTSLTQTRGFLWQNGEMQDLGSLGGPDTWANFVNDRGQVAGGSYTSYIIDPITMTPPVGAFLWEDGKMKDLGNLGGDNGLLGLPGIVAALNNRGQVTGSMMVAGNQFAHAFLWDGEKLLDLRTLGGNFSFARGINDAGAVVGLAWLPGDQLKHGVLWRDGVMTDLGTLGGDPCSDAISVNSKGQVVGASQSAAGGCGLWTTAFLWENGGPSVDLNSLVPSGSGVHLTAALWVNESGEIAAGGNPPGCGTDTCGHAYVLIPCDENHPGVEGCDYDMVDEQAASRESTASVMQKPTTTVPSTPALSGPSNEVRSMLRGRLGVSSRPFETTQAVVNGLGRCHSINCILRKSAVNR